MHAFLLLLVILPYAVVSGVIRTAHESPAIRANLRKDIATALVGALWTFVISDPWVFLKNAAGSMAAISGITDAPWGQPLLLVVMSYVAVQFIKIGIFRRQGDFNLLKLVAFTFLFGAAFLYSAIHLDRHLFGVQWMTAFLALLGLLSLVFVAGLHSVFARPILVVNVAGAVLSLLNTGTLTQEQFFLILDLIPKVPGTYGAIIIAISTATAAYNIGVERHWLRPLPIFAN